MPDLQILKCKVRFHNLLVLLTPFCYDSLESVHSEPVLVAVQPIVVLQTHLASRACAVLSSRRAGRGWGQGEGSEARAHPGEDFPGHIPGRVSRDAQGQGKCWLMPSTSNSGNYSVISAITAQLYAGS